MNKETLEKMAWLADKGFEPDMVDVGAGMLCPYDPQEKMDKELDAPYFTESRLWNLLGQPTIFWDNNTSLLDILLHKTIQSVRKGHLKPEEKD